MKVILSFLLVANYCSTQHSFLCSLRALERQAKQDDQIAMTCILTPKLEHGQAPKDRELEDVLRHAEAGVDEETRRFIDEVLKFVPCEPPPEIQVLTSHRGTGDAR